MNRQYAVGGRQYAVGKCRSVSQYETVSFVLGFVFMVLTTEVAFGQKRSDLEQRRHTLLQDISATNSELLSTKKTKAATSDRLEILERQVESREELINNLREETVRTDSIILRTGDVLESLSDDVAQLRKEYGRMQQKAYRTRLHNSPVLFILSSDNFTKAFKRWQYFQQYDKFRTRQARLIAETQKSLAAKNLSLTQKKAEKVNLLKSLEDQSVQLIAEKQDKDRMLQSLQEQESQLERSLATKQKSSSKLNSEIGRLIAEEERAKRRAAEEYARSKARESAAAEKELKRSKRHQNAVPAESPKEAVLTATPENLALSSDFRGSKGSLPWPVERGTIGKHFGRQEHATIKSVEVINNGVDIVTEQDAEVRAVFSGTVSVRQFIGGYNNVVIIQHGNYYTVYSNLAEVYVKKGDVVKTRQSIGKVAKDAQSGQSELHFEVWLEKTHLNPEGWIGKM